MGVFRDAHGLAADLVNGRDVGMVDRGSRFRLLHETTTPRFVCHQLGRQNLERHFPIEFRVERAVDNAHAAAAQLLLDFVVGERAA